MSVSMVMTSRNRIEFNQIVMRFDLSSKEGQMPFGMVYTVPQMISLSLFPQINSQTIRELEPC